MSENITKSISKNFENYSKVKLDSEAILLNEPIDKDYVNNIYKNKYYKYKKKYLQLKNTGGSKFENRIEKELKQFEDNNEFIVKNKSPYIFEFRDLIIELPNSYPFNIILKKKSTEENIDLSLTWSPSNGLKYLVDYYNDIIDRKKQLNKIPGNSDIYELSTLKDLDNEQKKWVMFKTLHTIGSQSFKNTVEFFKNNKCKLIISFDNNERNLELIEYFISYDENSRNDLVEYLFETKDIKYFICPDKKNIFFYNPAILNQLLAIINEHQVFEDELTIDELLELSCIWLPDETIDPIKYNLIHILFGSTNKCNWQSQDEDILTDMEINENENENEKMMKLKLAYNHFLNVINI